MVNMRGPSETHLFRAERENHLEIIYQCHSSATAETGRRAGEIQRRKFEMHFGAEIVGDGEDNANKLAAWR